MKLNLEIELDDVNEDYTLNDLFRDELKASLTKEVAKVLAKETLANAIRDEQVKELQKQLKEELDTLKREEHDKRKQVLNMIDDTFEDFLSGVAYKTNSFGEKTTETTVGEMLKERVEQRIVDFKQTTESLITKQIEQSIGMSDYSIKRLVGQAAKEAQNENAKKVAEFITKGAL